ncbi:MAG: shikimate kinase [Bacteroidales bacterium]|nr:shikimate kinase [Bacteroidales bacterium]
MNKPIFLIGFMGAGKTTLGRALAARLPRLTYIDLDEEIERHAGMSVSKIFATYGEKVFRTMEADALRDVASLSNVIVGCGGGTPCAEGNMELMNRCGTTVLLSARRPTLLRRLLEAQAQRPKLNGMSADEVAAYIDSALAERAEAYGKAQYSFPSDRLENEAEIEASCRFFIRKFLPGARS